MFERERFASVHSRAVLIAALLLSCVEFGGCGLGSSGSLKTSSPNDASCPVGLTGVMLLDQTHGAPRASGMKGVIIGYVVSHPGLPTDLTESRGKYKRPLLAFKLRMEITRTDGFVGAEDMHGRGRLDIFYDPDGFSDEILTDSTKINLALPIETDEVYFESMLDFTDDYRYYMRMHETAVATRSFRFAGADYRTPVGRVALNIMVGEQPVGVPDQIPIASSGVMPYLTPTAKLSAVAGPTWY